MQVEFRVHASHKSTSMVENFDESDYEDRSKVFRVFRIGLQREKKVFQSRVLTHCERCRKIDRQ
jgi:hypothetical protein